MNRTGNRLIDLTGRKFERLLATELVGRDKNGKTIWSCVCQCGNIVKTLGDRLRSGHTKSCGCLQKDTVRKNKTIHGYTTKKSCTSEYKSWHAMIQRCTNPNSAGFGDYGGRGITFCDRWRVFANFIADMGDKPRPELSLDRIDNNGNYEPENCKWSTRSEQMSNQRLRKNKTSQFKGVYLDSQCNRWKAYGILNGKRISLGRFDTESEAYEAIQRNGLAFHYPKTEITQPQNEE